MAQATFSCTFGAIHLVINRLHPPIGGLQIGSLPEGQIDLEDYLNKLYKECEQEIQNVLLINAIAEYASLKVEESDIIAFCKQNNWDIAQLQEREDYPLIWFGILQEKVEKYMLYES